jgi:hypothetical protein
VLRKLIVVAMSCLCFKAAAYGQTAVPSDNVTIQMNNNALGQIGGGHMQIQYNANGQGVNQSNDALIRFNLSTLPAGLNPANIQSASLILFVDGGGSPGTVTVCELVATPLWKASTVSGTNAPLCSAVATVSFNVSSTQLQNGSFIVVDVTAIVKDWISPTGVNNGIMLVADAPPSGINPINVQFDAMQNSGQGFPPQLQIVLQQQGPVGPAGPIGLQGPQGATGPAGPKGDTGATGASGAQGPIGLTGATGPQGPAGLTGATGSTGATGAIGPQGPQGIQGQAGQAGSAGATGSQGPKGDTGSIGATGPQGPSGPAGPDGTNGKGFNFTGPFAVATMYAVNDVVTYGGSSYVATNAIQESTNGNANPDKDTVNWTVMAVAGAVGPKGDTGDTGPQGLMGLIGPTGAAGQQGPQGIQGQPGQTGPIGATGPAGPKGDTGATGATGLTGATGAQGPTGLTGATGPQGPQGIQGTAGSAGAIGATGAVGPQGPTGATGPAGQNGTGFNFRSAWANNNLYQPNDVATYDGSSYVALNQVQEQSNSQTPDADTTNWKVMAAAGATGTAGPAGAQGPQGIQGFTGAPGATGAQGPMGLTGATGATGATGPQGPIGLIGPAGPTGATGATGLSGVTGAAGPQGPTGPTGPAGQNGTGFNFRNTWANNNLYQPNDVATYNGSSYVALNQVQEQSNSQTPDADTTNWKVMAAAGATGPAGPAGQQGIQGIQGFTGAPGATGATGPQGPIGLTGPAGPTGATGATGLTGATGATGPAGPTGATGLTGATGAAGTNGTSATIAVGTVTSGATAAVTNTGTSSAAVLNFTLPTSGRSPFQGMWVNGATYKAGDEVLRNCAVLSSPCSAGPFFNLTGLNADDPATDTTDWVYCCGTVAVGYTPFGGPITITGVGTTDNCIGASDNNGHPGYPKGTTCYVGFPGTIPGGSGSCGAMTGEFCSQPGTVAGTGDYAFNADNAGTSITKLTVTAPSALPASLQFTVQKNDVALTGFTCTIPGGGITCTVTVAAVSFGQGDRTNIIIQAPSANGNTGTSDAGVVITVQ